MFFYKFLLVQLLLFSYTLATKVSKQEGLTRTRRLPASDNAALANSRWGSNETYYEDSSPPLNVTVTNTPLPVVITNPTLNCNCCSSNAASITEVLINVTNQILQVINKKRCPPPYFFGPGNTNPCRCIGKSFYCIFNNIGKNREDAMSFCQALGFDGLVSYDTLDELNIVGDVARMSGAPGISYYYWASGIARTPARNFRWEPSNTPIHASIWQAGEPNNAGGIENCTFLDIGNRAKLYDVSCLEVLPYICEATGYDGV